MKGVGKLPERWEIQSRTVPAGAGPRGKAGGGVCARGTRPVLGLCPGVCLCVLGGLAPSLAFAQVCVSVCECIGRTRQPLPKCVCLCLCVCGCIEGTCPVLDLCPGSSHLLSQPQ